MIKAMMAALLLVAPAVAAQAQAPAAPAAPASPAPTPAAPQLADGAEYWTASDDRMAFTAARISFPRRAGAVALNRSIAFGQHNVGLDNGLIYASDDRALIATAYVYLPGFAHDGIAAVTSEHFMRLQSGAGFRLLRSRIAAAGGREGVAIRADYAGFRDANEASSSAFVQAGRWIVKLRVSGPESRRADVERTIAALLEGILFEGDSVPRAAEPLALVDCPPAPAAPTAALLAANAQDAAEDAIMAVAVGMRDEGLGARTERYAEATAFARRWCVSSFRRVGPYTLPILRALPSPPPEDSRRSVAIAILNDSGGALEIVERHFRDRSRYILLHHGTGRTRVLGAYDALPSDAQISALLEGTDTAGGQARATIDYRANGDSNVTLHILPDGQR